MNASTVLVLGLAVVLFAAIVRRIDSTPLSGPMIFTAAGVLLGGSGLGWLQMELSSSAIRTLVEVTLAIVLFSDASRIDLANLRSHWTLPGRLLSIGLPLCIALGALVALGVLRDIPWEGALLIGIMLAPTDAALGQAVITDESVPVYVRQGLNVESGLNDGMAFPLFEIAITVAVVGIQGVDASHAVTTLVREMSFGALAGVAMGATGGWLLSLARRAAWTGPHWQGIATLGLTAAAYGLALGIGGNGFIAAFAAGLAYRPTAERPDPDDVAGDIAELLTMIAFLVFGALVLGPYLAELDWRMAIYAILSLTVVRFASVAVALVDSHSRVPTIAFVGWFGPRGVASVLYSFLLLESVDELAVYEPVVHVVTLTVAVSVLLHGMTAAPLASRYGAWYSSMSHDHGRMVESTPVHEHRLGRGARHAAGRPDAAAADGGAGGSR